MNADAGQPRQGHTSGIRRAHHVCDVDGGTLTTSSRHIASLVLVGN